MATDSPITPWDEAVYAFTQHLKGTSRAAKTIRFYVCQLRPLAHWAEDNRIPLNTFGKAKLDEYLVWRQEKGHLVTGKQLSVTTLHHDALAAKVLMKYCSRYDLIPRNLLADYQVRTAPQPHKHMPTEEEIVRILRAFEDFWDPGRNRPIRAFSASRRTFHLERNMAVIMVLLDSACRIGEALSLKQDDIRQVEVTVKGQPRTIWQATIRESGSSVTTKGRQSRFVPLTPGTVEAVQAWQRVRARTMREAPVGADQGWLFISETGERCDESRFTKTLQKVSAWAELPRFNAHMIRRFSLNKLSKIDVLAAQRIAGHKDTKTTLIYTELDAGHVADVHERAGVVSGILQSKRIEKKRRLTA